LATTTPVKAGLRIRHNYLAIVAAGIASFALEAIWYSVFLKVWEAGIEHTQAWLEANSPNFGIQLAVALASAILMAIGLDCIIQLTGPQSAAHGMKVGALLWLGFILTVFCTEYIFEVRPMSLFGVNAGFWLISIVVMGAIVGGWKKK
jgi:hypothetical protein